MRREIGVAQHTNGTTNGADELQLIELIDEGTYGKVFKGEWDALKGHTHASHTYTHAAFILSTAARSPSNDHPSSPINSHAGQSGCCSTLFHHPMSVCVHSTTTKTPHNNTTQQACGVAVLLLSRRWCCRPRCRVLRSANAWPSWRPLSAAPCERAGGREDGGEVMVMLMAAAAGGPEQRSRDAPQGDIQPQPAQGSQLTAAVSLQE